MSYFYKYQKPFGIFTSTVQSKIVEKRIIIRQKTFEISIIRRSQRTQERSLQANHEIKHNEIFIGPADLIFYRPTVFEQYTHTKIKIDRAPTDTN